MNARYCLVLLFVVCGVSRAEPTPKVASSATLTGHKGFVWALAFSPDGKTLASTAREAESCVRLWDVGTGKKIAALKGHDDSIMGLAFHPNGKMLAAASLDKTVILWNPQTQREIGDIKEPNEGLPDRVAFSADGKTLAFGGDIGDETVYLWDVAKKEVTAKLDGHTYGADIIVASGDAPLVAVASRDGRIRIWDTKTAKEVGVLGERAASFEEAKPQFAVAFLPRAKEVLSINGEGALHRWDVRTGKSKSLLLKHPNEFATAVISPDGGLVATGDGKGIVRLWDAKTGRLLTTFEEHTDTVHVLAFNTSSTTLASGSSDQSIKLWKVPSQVKK